MGQRLVGTVLVSVGLITLGACTSERARQATGSTTGLTEPADPTSGSASVVPTSTPSSQASTPPTTATGSSTPAASSSTTQPPPTTDPEGSTTSTSEPRKTTTTTEAPLPVENPKCVVRIAPGESLSSIANGLDRDGLTVATLVAENGIDNPNRIEAGDFLDICVRNRINDITGERRVRTPPPSTPPTTNPPANPFGTGVQAQQEQLNRLFAGKGLPALAVDGDSGSLTQQQLCAARALLGLPVSRADVAPGSDEERALMAAGGLPIPGGAPSGSARWALIDVTCQVMFIGQGAEQLSFVFPTSTGEPGFETPEQRDSRVFRFDPARKNGGWHDSADYPSAIDNPLNGNMYKPLYFDGGRAIHGAGYVPTDPQSKGCARLAVPNQDTLVYWLGLFEEGAPIWDTGRIDFTVSVQGRY